MSDISTPPPPPPGRTPPAGPSRQLPTLAKVLLFGVLPVLLAILAVMAVLTIGFARGGSANQAVDLTAGSSVEVDIRNATLEFEPSTDDQIHVRLSGYHWGREPRLITDDSGEVTTIIGGCRGGFFSMCRIDVVISLPRALTLSAEGSNGAIRVEDLSGELSLRTSNGAVEVQGGSGKLEAHTTNGAITVEGSTASSVEASTSNGRVAVDFDRAPRRVDVSTSNGAITVRVPDDESEYNIDADTSNGTVNTDRIPTDNDSARSITARTSNGSITIEADGR